MGRMQRALKKWRNTWRLSAVNDGQTKPVAFIADAPILHASDDRLRRTKFAQRLASVLAESTMTDGRIVAIRGGWGEGKSSLKNLIVETLASPPHSADWLEFNPWQWGDGDTISRALFGQIADKIGGGLSRHAADRAKLIRRYAGMVVGAGDPLEKLGKQGGAISSALSGASFLAILAAIGWGQTKLASLLAGISIAAVLLPPIGRLALHRWRDRWAEPLPDIRRTLERDLRSLDHPLIVFVDDIDRLEPDQIRLLIRQVKVNANLPNITFVLLYQKSIVEAALDEISKGEGRAFLEKIVQAAFDLPRVPLPVIHSFVTGELAQLAGPYATPENGFEQVRWGNILLTSITPFIRNLRDARRYLASAAIHLPLHVNGEVFEANLLDFLALETLRVFEPDIHARLYEAKDLLLQWGRYSNDGRDAQVREKTVALTSDLPDARRTIVETSLALVFPKSKFSDRGYGNDFLAEWTREKRAATERFFSQYFELQAAMGELSEGDFVTFLKVSDDPLALADVVSRFEERGVLLSLVSRLDESVHQIPVPSAPVLLPVMFDIAQKFASYPMTDPFSAPSVRAWRSISWYLKRLPEDDREGLLIDALRKTCALSVMATIIHLNDPNDREDTQPSTREPDLAPDALERIKAEWVNQVEGMAASGALLAAPEMLNLLYRWADYSGDHAAPLQWVQEQVRTPDGFARVMTAMMRTAYSQNFEDQVAVPVKSYDRSSIDRYFKLSELRSLLSVHRDHDFTPEHADALDVLDKYLSRWEAGKSSSSCWSDED